jgi:ComEC/Rec2-related protein
MKRPLLSVAVAYAAGILLAEFIRFPPLLLLLVTGLGLAVVSLVWARVRRLLLWPLILLAGAANLALHTAVISPRDLRNLLGSEPQIATVRGRLRETPQLRIYAHGEQESWRTMAQVEVTAIRLNKQQEWRPAFGRMAITTRGTLTNLFAGQVVEVSGVARLPRLPDAPGTFDYRKYLSELGIYYQLQAESENDWRLVSSPVRPPLSDRFRTWARKALALGLPAEDESLRLEWALTLGWKTALTEEVSEPFIQAATYHIFAVDGLRMAIIFGIFLVAFRVVGMPRVACGLVLFPVIWMYTALTGWPASAIRASVMLSVIMGGWVLKRPSDMLNSLFAAAIIILVWAPQQLFQAGFQLSFCVVLCIILIVPALNRIVERVIAGDPLRPPQLRPRLPEWAGVPVRYVIDLLIISFAAWVGSLPLVAYYFHVLTPVSTPANVIAVPLCALVLISNFSTFLVAGWFPAAAGVLNHAGWFLMECIRVTSHWFADWPRAYFYVPAPSLFTSCLYYALLVAVATGRLFQQRLRVRKLAGAGLALLVWGYAAWTEHDSVRLTILPLNGGCATYFDGPGTKPDLLVDCGADKSVQSVTKPFLRAQGVNRLPGMVLTHGDVRHVGGASEVAGLFGLETAYASPVRFRSAIYRQIIERFSRPPPILRTISRRDSVGSWTVLHPERDDHFAQADDNALVLLGNLGGTRVLLLSDLGRPGQTALLERAPDLRADIVVSGLPAQTEALGDSLLDAIRPRLIIVVDSEFPVTERAGAKLRERLAKRGVPVIYTREAGAVTLEFRGGKWELRTINGRRMRSRDV